MFNSRTFNFAFLVSLTWHLVCMTAVNIVVLPGNFKIRELTSVSFLGPILETTALDILLANKPVAVTTVYQSDLKYSYSFDTRSKEFIKDDAKRNIGIQSDNQMFKALDVEFEENKIVANIATDTNRHERYERYQQVASGVFGPASNRKVYFKPVKPKLPSWISASAPFKLELKFSVSSQGEVEEVIPIVSSGNPEVDLLGVRYLKGWKFAPVARGKVRRRDDEQWGRITFIFDNEQKAP